MHFEKLSVLYNQLVVLESDIKDTSNKLHSVFANKKVIEDMAQNVNKLKNLNARTNIMYNISIATASFIAGCSLMLYAPITQMIADHKVNQEKQFKQIPIQLAKQEQAYNQKLSLIQQQHQNKTDALKEDFEIQKVQLEADKNEAISKYKSLKANNHILKKLQSLDVKLKLTQNKVDKLYILSIDNKDRNIYIPSSSSNRISFKPN